MVKRKEILISNYITAPDNKITEKNSERIVSTSVMTQHMQGFCCIDYQQCRMNGAVVDQENRPTVYYTEGSAL